MSVALPAQASTLTRSVAGLTVVHERVVHAVGVVRHEVRPKLKNATHRPSAEMDGTELPLSACAPDESTLTRSVVPDCRSCTKTSAVPFVSFGTRFAAALSNATKRPSAEMAGFPQW